MFRENIFLSHCFVSPLAPSAVEAIEKFIRSQALNGFEVFHEFSSRAFHDAVALLLKVSPTDISLISNTAQALSCVALGYPFEPKDEVLFYEQEYPSNVYPWLALKERSVNCKIIPSPQTAEERRTNHPLQTDNIVKHITARTRVIALSHVQFLDGFALDLESLSYECKIRNIDLVIDGAQSVGAIAIYPDLYGIGAFVFPAWKFLRGPTGIGAMVTSPQFRAKIKPVLWGPDMMKQQSDYLNHSVDPFDDGRKFEYSTTPHALAQGVAAAIHELLKEGPMEDISKRILNLIDVFLKNSDGRLKGLSPVSFTPEPKASPILALEREHGAPLLVTKLRERAIVVTSRRSMIRIAPHHFISEDSMKYAAEQFIELS